MYWVLNKWGLISLVKRFWVKFQYTILSFMYIIVFSLIVGRFFFYLLIRFLFHEGDIFLTKYSKHVILSVFKVLLWLDRLIFLNKRLMLIIDLKTVDSVKIV